MDYIISVESADDMDENQPKLVKTANLTESEWLKLRSLFDNDFENDEIVKSNIKLFENIWSDLHGVQLYREKFEHHKYDYKCFAVETIGGKSDFRYRKI